MNIPDVAVALSSEVRLMLLRAITPNKTFAELAVEVGVAPNTLTHHVGILERAGLVDVETVGRRRYLHRKYAEVWLGLV